MRDVAIAVAVVLAVLVVLGLTAVIAAGAETRRSHRAARELLGGMWDVDDARDDVQ